MENKLISRVLFGFVAVLFLVSFYFFYGMMANGKPQDFDPAQLGVELIEQGQASNADYMEKGQAAYESKIEKLESNILSGIGFMNVLLYLAGGLMIVFLLVSLFQTVTSDIKKAIPSLIFVGVTGLAFIYAFINSGTDTTGFDSLVANQGEEEAKSVISLTNFWVNGLLFVLIPGSLLLVIDLLKDIAKGFSK